MKNLITTSIIAITALQPFSQSALAYELHEWGTFTSVTGSDGVLLAGLHVEEEKLPHFVYALDGMQNIGPTYSIASKGFRLMRPLKNVTIKMETPVLYFYSDQPFHAQVKVGFKGGSISQWYPQRSGGETAPKITPSKPRLPVQTGEPAPTPLTPQETFKRNGGIDFATQYTGAIEWEVDVLGKDADRGLAFKPGETLNWVYPRNPKANLLKVAGSKDQPDQYEDYLFYRGVGKFPLPVQFTVATDETITISNTGKESIPFLFVHEITPNGITRFRAIHQGVEAGKTLNVPVSDLVTQPKWQRSVYQQMFKGLTGTGLFSEEAHGMIQTWWHSYFSRPGLRVFWVVPTSDTNEILPLSVKPAPQKIVRTLVGRSEILRPSFENNLVKAYTETDKKKRQQWNQYMYSRFGQAYLERVQKLAPKKATAIGSTN